MIKSKKVLLIAGLFLLGVLIITLLFFQSGATGKAILGLQTNYVDGDFLDGNLSLSLKAGELIPANTLVVVEAPSGNYEYLLSDIVTSDKVSGDFYIDKTLISGSGEGYGVAGVGNTYPNVEFTLRVISSGSSTGGSSGGDEEDSLDDEVVENNSSEEDTGADLNDEITEEISEDDSEEQNLNISGGVLTGNVISQTQNEVSGVVSKNNPFTYNLNDGESVELVFSSEDVEVSVSSGVVSVTTDYSEVGEGFGKDFLGEYDYILEIPLNNLGVLSEEGILIISLIYDGTEISSISTTLSADFPSSEVVEEVELNETINETINEASLDSPSKYQLTTAEQFLIQGATGESTVRTVSSIEKNQKLILRFEIGNYWMEKSYDASRNVENEVALDSAKWLKNIAKSLS